MAEARPNHPEVIHGIEALRPDHGRLFVVIGVFDGLHLGHLYLLRHLQVEARARGARSAVITFDHHPDEILVGTAPPLLCDPDERLELLADAGVEVTVVQTFDAALRMTGYDAFVQRIADRVDLAGFLMTPDAAFGYERRGTVETVRALGRQRHYEVVVVPALELGGRQVRSSDIRAAIGEGDLGSAATMLGRPYAVTGQIGSTPGARVVLRFPMPVALPPAGEYPVDIRFGPGDAARARGMVVIRVDGTVEVLSPGVAALTVDGRPDRLRVTFSPVPDAPHATSRA
ncbi:MAG: FAD synthetase family protein [Chloroflexi bacterium]|nr:FAD synthetase family protein [Chloroflexota bacterium]